MSNTLLNMRPGLLGGTNTAAVDSIARYLAVNPGALANAPAIAALADAINGVPPRSGGPLDVQMPSTLSAGSPAGAMDLEPRISAGLARVGGNGISVIWTTGCRIVDPGDYSPEVLIEPGFFTEMIRHCAMSTEMPIQRPLSIAQPIPPAATLDIFPNPIGPNESQAHWVNNVRVRLTDTAFNSAASLGFSLSYNWVDGLGNQVSGPPLQFIAEPFIPAGGGPTDYRLDARVTIFTAKRVSAIARASCATLARNWVRWGGLPPIDLPISVSYTVDAATVSMAFVGECLSPATTEMLTFLRLGNALANQM